MIQNRLTLNELFAVYLDFREKSGLKREMSRLIPSFINVSIKIFSGPYLEKEMVDAWCLKHDTETSYSHMQRIGQLCNFLKFAHERNYIDFELPTHYAVRRDEKPPFAFAREGLSNFFRACDEYDSNSPIKILTQFNKIEIPPFFRLLYSTGMRTTEARLLLCEDVDLNTGVIAIRHTKGYDQHTIVLHDSMLALLIAYNEKMNLLLPDRKIFFPTPKDQYHKTPWVCHHFNEAWEKYNDSSTVAYQLRHNYATENINSWINKGYEVHDKFMYLSKSMGHTRLDDTLYYYGLVPRLFDIIEDISADKFNEIIPEINYETK